MIVWISSYPRSGNTYFRMLLHRLYKIKTYSIHYDDPDFQRRPGFADAVGHAPLPAPIPHLLRENKPYFVKTHYLPNDPRLPNEAIPAIYIVRDGRDTLISYARYQLGLSRRVGKRAVLNRLKELAGLRSFRRSLQSLIVNPGRYGSWSNNVFSWTCGRRPGRIVVIRYEDLVQDPVGWIKDSLDQLNVRLEPVGGCLPDFGGLHQKWPDFFRKGQIGNWREEMPEDLQQLFWLYHSAAIEYFGYSKD